MTWRMIAVIAVLSLAMAGPALADSPRKPDYIMVFGQGVVRAAPDMASVTVGVATAAPEATVAVAANNAAAARLHDALKANGIRPEDIQTTRFSVYPQYENVEGRLQPRIVGYTVENTVQVTIRSLASLGEMLDLLIASGANTVGGIEFGLSDPAGVADAARREALKDAGRKAALYAAEAGVTLGRVLAIEERARGEPIPMAMESIRAAPAVPIAPGAHEVSVEIAVRYAIE